MASPVVAGNGMAADGDAGGVSALSPPEFRALLYNPPASAHVSFPTLCDFANRGEKVPQHAVDTRTKFWENKGLKLPAWSAQHIGKAAQQSHNKQIPRQTQCQCLVHC